MKIRNVTILYSVMLCCFVFLVHCKKDKSSILIDFNEIEHIGEEGDSFGIYPIVHLSPTDKSYNKVFYSKGGVTFYGKYRDYGYFGPDTFFVYAFDNEIGFDKIPMVRNSNFNGRFILLAEADVRIDFSALGYANKQIEFDVAADFKDFDQGNEFAINGFNKETGPNVIKTKIIPYDNGCHVTITGEVDNLEWFGEFTGYDNLKVTEL